MVLFLLLLLLLLGGLLLGMRGGVGWEVEGWKKRRVGERSRTRSSFRCRCRVPVGTNSSLGLCSSRLE